MTTSATRIGIQFIIVAVCVALVVPVIARFPPSPLHAIPLFAPALIVGETANRYPRRQLMMITALALWTIPVMVASVAIFQVNY